MRLAQRYTGVLLVALLTGIAAPGIAGPPLDSALQALAADVFHWRVRTQPCMPDDIPRVERPAGWVPDLSPAALEAARQSSRSFRSRLNALPRDHWSRADSVDYLLVRSVVERAAWELDVLALPHRNPDFYLQQTLGALWELLVIRPPVDAPRIAELLRRLRSIPVTLGHAYTNLNNPVRPFARIALHNLEGVRARIRSTMQALPCREAERPALISAADSAADALERFGVWLKDGLPRMDEEFHVGRDAYRQFLTRIALIPMSPEEMLLHGRAEFHRAAALEVIEMQRGATLPPLPVFASITEQLSRTAADERAIRKFLEKRNLLTIPKPLRHYTNLPIPPYLAPLAGVGELDDFTSPRRLAEDAVRYIPPPSPTLSFFPRSMAQDPRPIIIHEGIPGHYFQLAASWNHEDPVRRFYVDSGPNEGWGFYVEEMLLQMGLFDTDRPQTRAVIYRFMRLRALRVEADVRLALGEWRIHDAARFLAQAVPMDLADAEDEAAFFASTPGQAMTYQIGKVQILQFLADSRMALGERFDLRAFHDRCASNGNVPVALQRWEALGNTDDVGSLW